MGTSLSVLSVPGRRGTVQGVCRAPAGHPFSAKMPLTRIIPSAIQAFPTFWGPSMAAVM